MQRVNTFFLIHNLWRCIYFVFFLLKCLGFAFNCINDVRISVVGRLARLRIVLILQFECGLRGFIWVLVFYLRKYLILRLLFIISLTTHRDEHICRKIQVYIYIDVLHTFK